MNIHLIVVKPFSGLARGDLITDDAHIASILRSEQATHVVRILAPSQKEG